MKLKNSYFYTLREDAKDEESTSGNLLVRSGMIKKVGAGIYMYLPLGYKTLNNIMKIIKEEMDNAGAQELLMPSLIPSEYYEKCGRVAIFGDDMFNLKDRYNKAHVLGPTHEELFTIAAKAMVKSYKDLHFTLYQQADKFRDEPRPRYGLIRVREFIMKDAYSFDKDEEGLDVSYLNMKNAYNKIYDRLGINYKIVRADNGAMGGSLSEEYQAITDIGEDVLVLCKDCDYASNLEIAQTVSSLQQDEEEKEIEMVHTPHQATIEDVCKYLNIDVKHSVKALLMNADGELVICFIRGDRELCENKVCKVLGIRELNFANDELIATSNAVPGYTGPINLNAKVIIDNEILQMKNFCCGANKEEYHYINANVKDINYDIVADIVNVQEGDKCPHCGGELYFKKGIEIGNLFKLGTKYAENLGLTYLDENNKENVVIMGSYGIGPGRILASIVEQNNDENGLILPMSIAPYQVALVQIDMKNDEQTAIAEQLYQELLQNNIEVIYDNRDERPGVKFKDMDLIGIPLRITIGKKITDNLVELKERRNKEQSDIKIDEVVEKVKQIIKDNLK
ncbi:MAG TPA: proline--tRNA ligase [Candidatus Coprovivens excrementavium]|nr:proline--tRNA ligase [Candidatus Coprovivens excrementavium]